MKFVSLLVVSFLVSGVFGIAVADNQTAKADADSRDFIELFPSDIKAPFTQKTVTKLNAIVRRSYDAINEYDDIVDGVRVSVNKAASPEAVPGLKARAEEKVAKIYELDEASKSALADMMAAAKELRSSDELFNNAILEGMIQFVEEVENEIGSERVALDSKLESA